MGLSDHLDKLKAFVVIAEAGSLHEAAQRLHVTQPALSRMLKTIEEAAGTELCVRSRQGVSLTAAGKELVQYANCALKDLSNLERKMAAPPDTLSGHIHVGTYESLVEYLWPDFLRGMQTDYPELAVSLRTSSPVGMIELLRRDEIDIVVDAEPRTTGDFISWPIYKDRFNFYVRPGGATKFDQESAKDLTLIYVPQAFDEDERTILYHLENRGYAFSKKLTLDSFTAAQKFCAKGIGLAVLPMRLQTSHNKLNSTELAHLAGFPTRGFGDHSICATVRSNQKDHPHISEFVKNLKQWFKTRQ